MKLKQYLIHTELFPNVSGLGLIHCGLGLEKILWASASCPAGLVNIADCNPGGAYVHIVINTHRHPARIQRNASAGSSASRWGSVAGSKLVY